MKCPYCGHPESKVVDSRPNGEADNIRRRRECEHCGKRFTTYEVVETLPIIVIKKDGKRETYDRNKLVRGILRACEKRPVSIEQIENLVDDVEQIIRNSLDREIVSGQIGELVMEGLKQLDEVAYVRFASVYRSFKDIDSFRRALETLENEKYNNK